MAPPRKSMPEQRVGRNEKSFGAFFRFVSVKAICVICVSCGLGLIESDRGCPEDADIPPEGGGQDRDRLHRHQFDALADLAS